jgi:23S rRNA (adenine2503-C2)-methyltransferase
LFISRPFGTLPKGLNFIGSGCFDLVLGGYVVEAKIDLKNMTHTDLVVYLDRLGQPAFRARQLLKWIYQQRVTDFADMTNVSKSLRDELSARCRISTLTPVTVQHSRDGTRKYLFQLEDGATIEAVRIPMETDKATLCISTRLVVPWVAPSA